MRTGLDFPGGVRGAISAFLRWWGEELAGLLPHGLRRLFSRGGSRLVVDVGDGVGTLSVHGAGPVRPLGQLDLGAAEQGARLARGVRSQAARADEVVIRLSSEDVVGATVVLPAATEENLAEVLAFEMDRYTPFRAEQVYYDYRLLSRDPERGKIRVQLVAMPRARLDAVVDAVRRWGLAPAAVEVAHADPEPAGPRSAPINLLPKARRPRRNGAHSRLNRALLALAAGLVAAAVAIPLMRKAQLVSSLEHQVAEARTAAQSVQRTRTELEQSTEEVAFLAQRKHASPAVIDLLEALTRLLPDDTWLLRFELRNGHVKIQGESPTASTLISIIESSPLFRDTSFVAPVTQNPRTGLERFVITARVVGEVKT
jgi:general secretion pathway protein L